MCSQKLLVQSARVSGGASWKQSQNTNFPSAKTDADAPSALGHTDD